MASSRSLGFFESCTAADPSCVVLMVAHLGLDNRLSNTTAFGYAVQKVCRRHPNLRSLLSNPIGGGGDSGSTCSSAPSSLCVVPDYEKNHDVCAAHSDIVKVAALYIETRKNWKEIVHAESNTPFDLSGTVPYWKIVLIQEMDHDILVVKFHHCIGDASSGYILINDILTFYADSVNLQTHGAQSTLEIEEDNNILPVLQSVNEMCFPTGRTPEEEDYVNQSVLQLQQRRRDWVPKLEFSHPDHETVVASAIRPHSILYRDGTPDNLNRLLLSCREKGVTIGAVLAAATYFCVAKMYQANHASDDNSITEDSPFALDFDMDVNLRSRFPKPLGNDHVGAYIGMMAFQLSVKPSTIFWEFTKQVKEAIHMGLQEKQHFHYLEVNARLDAMEAVAASAPATDDTLAMGGTETLSALRKELHGKYGKDWKDLSTVEQEAALALGYDERIWNKHGHVQDMNFSNVGRYFFSPTVGSVTIEKIYCVGGGWCPTFGSYIFLIPAVKSLHFCLVHETSALNDRVGKQLLTLAADLVETAWSLPETYTLADYMK